MNINFKILIVIEMVVLIGLILLIVFLTRKSSSSSSDKSSSQSQPINPINHIDKMDTGIYYLTSPDLYSNPSTLVPIDNNSNTNIVGGSKAVFKQIGVYSIGVTSPVWYIIKNDDNTISLSIDGKRFVGSSGFQDTPYSWNYNNGRIYSNDKILYISQYQFSLNSNTKISIPSLTITDYTDNSTDPYKFVFSKEYSDSIILDRYNNCSCSVTCNSDMTGLLATKNWNNASCGTGYSGSIQQGCDSTTSDKCICELLINGNFSPKINC